MKHPPHSSILRIGLVFALSGAGALVAGASNAPADACTSGDVAIGTQQGAHLTRSLRLTVHATCEDIYDATARGYLYVGGHRTWRLQALTLTGVQTAPTTMTVTIPGKVLSATRAYARRGNHHYRYAVLKFVVTSADRLTGLRYPHAYETYSRLRL